MINAEKIALAAYYGRNHDYQLLIKLFARVGLDFMDNLLFIDIQFVIKHIIEKEGIDPDSLSLSSIHSHYFGKDMYQQHTLKLIEKRGEHW